MGTSADSLQPSIQPGALQSQMPAPRSNPSTRRSHRAVIAALALLPALSLAAPMVFEETAKIASPDPTLDIFPLRLAVEGDTIIATGVKYVYELENGETNRDWEYHYVYQFQRQSNGTWQYLRTLASTRCDTGEVGEDTCLASVAIRNGIAVVAADKVHVFERDASGSWIEAASDNFSGPGEAAVGTGVVLTSQPAACTFTSEAMRKNAAGIWTTVMTFPGSDTYGCDDWGITGQDNDISIGNRVITTNTWEDGDGVNIYEPTGSTWTHTANLVFPENSYFGGVVAIDDARALVSGSFETPIHVFNRGTGAWGHTLSISTPDSARTGSPGVIKVRDLIIAGLAGDPHRGGSVAVYKQTSTNQYQQVARLVASNPSVQRNYLGWGDVDAEVSGSTARVIAGATDGLYVFDLKKWGTTAAPLQENFEAGASHWTPMAGSTFSVVTSGESKVYRQSSVVGDAGSFVTSIDWTNQAIEADVKPTAFSGTGRWAGLAVRRTDASNYYYAALYQSNVLTLKRMQNGAFVTLASVALPVVLNRTYRLRVEAIGTLLRVYVDGRLALEKHDTALTHGHAGVRMYKAAADFDNVIVSQNPHLTLLDEHNNDSAYALERHWNFAPGSWSVDYSTGNPRIRQQNATGDASAVTVVNANDQIIQTRATLNSFASGSGTRWFGIMARYVDSANYYYVTVRRENTISLRKMVNGTITVLDTAPLTVTPGSAYNLRLEAIGNSLRAYVNGNLLVEASDTTHKSGKYGLVMYSAKATYEDFTAWEP
jgi:hypothetical protein